MTSSRKRERDRLWFHGVVLKAGNTRTNVLNLATALHREALGSELARTPGWNARTFEAIQRWPIAADLWNQWSEIFHDIENPRHKADAKAFFDAHADAMVEGAKVLWPEQESLYALMMMREESGRTTFEREKQCRPINAEQCEWPEEYFGPHIWFEQWPKNILIKTIALDPSKGKDSKKGDYSSYVMLGVDDHDGLYFQSNMARRPIPQMVAAGVELYRTFRPDVFGLEANAWQDLLAPDFEQAFRDAGLLAAPIETIENRVNKETRIARLGAYLAQRRIRFKANCASTKLLVEQMRDFPLGDHDDGPDAAEMAIRLAERFVHQSSQVYEDELYT